MGFRNTDLGKEYLVLDNYCTYLNPMICWKIFGDSLRFLSVVFYTDMLSL